MDKIRFNARNGNNGKKERRQCSNVCPIGQTNAECRIQNAKFESGWLRSVFNQFKQHILTIQKVKLKLTARSSLSNFEF